jgi:hypothetical protein
MPATNHLSNKAAKKEPAQRRGRPNCTVVKAIRLALDTDRVKPAAGGAKWSSFHIFMDGIVIMDIMEVGSREVQIPLPLSWNGRRLVRKAIDKWMWRRVADRLWRE